MSHIETFGAAARRLLPTAACAAMLAAAITPAAAQQNSGGMSNGSMASNSSNGTMATSLASADQDYLRKNAQGSTYDLALAQLGVLRARSATVREYARMVVNDHTRLNLALLDLGHRENMMDLPVTLSQDDQSKLQRLQDVNEASFDEEFLAEEVRINAEDVSDAEKQIKQTNSAEVRRAADFFRATEARHLAQAKRLQGSRSQ